MATYITAEVLLDESISLVEVAECLQALSMQDALACCGWLMARLYKPGAGGPDVQQQLIDVLCKGPTKRRATALVNDRWVFMAPQIVLGVVKMTLVLDHPAITNPNTDAMVNVVLAALGLAQYLGSRSVEGDRMWGSLPEGLSLDIVANQHFNASANTSAVIARHHMLWRELPNARDPEIAELHEEAFIAATGTTMDTCNIIGLALLMQVQTERTGHIPADYVATLKPTEEELAAIDLFVADVSTLRDECKRELARTGFSWAANSFRRFPIVRHPDGSMTVIIPDYLRDRACGWAVYWELNNHFNRTNQWGSFKDFRGRIPEDYVGTSLVAMYPEVEGGAKRLWTESELQRLWPNEQICDFVVDTGDAWICIEVVSHVLSEGAATANSVEAIEHDIRIIAEEKAEQLDSTARALLAEDALHLLGRTSVPAKVLPVVIATGGFPVNPITMNVIHERVSLLGFLQGSCFSQLEILNLDTLEAIEAIAERGGPTFGSLLADKATAGLRLSGMDLYMAVERHLDLPCPARLRRPLDEAVGGVVRWTEALRSRLAEEVNDEKLGGMG